LVAVRDQLPGVEGVAGGHQAAQLVVAEVHDVLGVVEPAVADQRPADRDQHQAHAGVGPLVDVEVVVRGERVHPQAQVQRPLQLVARRAGRDALQGLRLGRLQVVGDRLELCRVVVVGLQVAADRLDDRGRVLAPGAERELVRPHRLEAEHLLVGHDPVGHERPAGVGRLERAQDVTSGRPLERLGDLALLGLDPLLDLPELLDRVPVAVLGRALEPAHEGAVVALALGGGDRRVERQGGGELGEVQHPVDLPVPVVHVDRVLEQDRELDQAGLVVVVLVEADEVALHLRPEPAAPPLQEVLGVVGERPAHVGAQLGRVLGVERDPGGVAAAVLARLRGQPGLGRDGRGVDVAVDDLDDPVGGERRAEAAEHVVALEPPAADVGIHRRHGVRDVQVVVHPEQLALAVLPVDGEVLVAEEGRQHLVVAHAHPRSLVGGQHLRRSSMNEYLTNG
jgi:hypothetical protein